MPTKLRTSDPYQTLLKNLFSLQIFDRSLNGSLHIRETDVTVQTLLIEREFVNTSEMRMTAGFVLIQCFSESMSDQDLRNFRSLVEDIVRRKTQGNYMDVNPIIIAPSFTESVYLFIQDYNKMQSRQPIERYEYE